jgi:hypothetical protein
MRTLPRVLSLSPLLLSAALAQTSPAGRWEGSLQLPDREIKIAVDLAKDDKGAWAGTFTPIEQNAHIPLANIKVDGTNVKFHIGPGDNSPNFDCTLDGAAMKCTASNEQGSVPASLRRTGEAKIDAPKASAAVSKQLEGDWEGTLNTPNGSLQVIVHLKNQPDNTVKGSMDSPSQGATGLELTAIVQKDTSFEFQLPMVGGSYKGSLNKEATEIAGDWMQGGGSLPLTLKKSAAK